MLARSKSLPCHWALVIFVSIFSPPSLRAVLVWETKRIEIIAEPHDEEIYTKFSFENQGQQSIEILDISTGCECTAVIPSKVKYEPGESGELEVIFTVGDRMGPQERVINVRTDHPHKPESALVLRVELPERIIISNRVLRWSVGGAISAESFKITPVIGNQIIAVRRDNKADHSSTIWEIVSSNQGEEFSISMKPKSVDGSFTDTHRFIALFKDGTKGEFYIYTMAR